MYYLKIRSNIGAGTWVEDYFEADADGALLRLVSHVDGKWWSSPHSGDDGLHLPDLSPNVFITGEEFEHAWQLAGAHQPVQA